MGCCLPNRELTLPAAILLLPPSKCCRQTETATVVNKSCMQLNELKELNCACGHKFQRFVAVALGRARMD
ncbi:hypothetical protein BDA96_03G046700 [Sorghum bicolor]|uniref:Uncharacterized protein n=1 Tax=Sorghum bicolor TaxID=4558 RepID=A0A921UM11_SORBI|nr:hypothetical protein BDA96_03G046700 [Sorghum bicolor]